MHDIINIARKVKNACEKFALSKKAKNYDFYKVKDLKCMCAVASFALKRALAKIGIKSKVIKGKYNGEDHCWVELGDKIIDITATQFRVNKRVYVVNKDCDSYCRCKELKKFNEIGWRKEQTPNRVIIRKMVP